VKNILAKKNIGKEEIALIENFISLSLLRGLEMLLPLITFPYLVRILGLEKYGLIALASALAMYFSAVIQYGFNVTSVREIARNKESIEIVSKIFSLSITISAILFLLSLVIVSIIVSLFNKFSADVWLYIVSFLWLSCQAFLPLWFFSGFEKLKIIAVVNVLTKLGTAVCIFTFIEKPEDYMLVPLFNLIFCLVSLVAAFFVISKKFSVIYTLPGIKEIKNYMTDGSHAFISQVAPTLYNNSSVFVLGVFASPSVVGVYSAALRLIDVFATLGAILSSVFLPYLARKRECIPLFNKWMLVTGVCLAAFCFAGSDTLVNILFSQGNMVVASYVDYLVISIPALFAVYAFGTNSLMLAGQDKLVKSVALYTSLSFFIVGMLVIPLLGIVGSCLIIVGARLTMALSYISLYKSRFA
jgi:Membrane protein involved in the export of O-antigen and teichoic acid